MHDFILSIQDVVTSIVFVLCLFAGAVSNAAYSSDNADTYEDYRCDSTNISVDRESVCDDLTTVRDGEGATAVSFSVTSNCTVSLCWEHCTVKYQLLCKFFYLAIHN